MIAIVIPAYDMHHQGVHFLRRALESISKQKQVDFSQMIVVVSDHSVNFAIEKFLKGYQPPFQVHYVRNQSHFGNISHNLNLAIEFVLQNSPASYIKVLFQDDYLLEEDYLVQILQLIQETKPDAIITGATHSTDGKNCFNPITPKNNPFLIFGQNTISSPSTLTLSRQVCEQERCDEHVQLFMDVDWYYRIFKSYSSIVYAPHLFVVNGVWDGQMQHQFDAQGFTQELAYVLGKYEVNQLRAQIPNYLELLHEKHPEHAVIVDPLVRPLGDLHSEQIANTITSTHDANQSSATDYSVDVVLTTCNAAEHINFSIRNALLQSAPPNKIIVVDTNTDDDTLQMVQSIYVQEPRVQVIRCPGTQSCQARQLGMTQSDSAYIALLHCTADDHPTWKSHYLKEQVTCLAKNPDAIGALGAIRMRDQKDEQSSNCLAQLPACGFASNVFLNRRNCISDAAFLDQLRLAQQHGQWQLLSALFHLKFAPAAQVLASLQSRNTDVALNEPMQKILLWWSAHARIILTKDPMLELIRQAFIQTFELNEPSLLEHLGIFHRRYQQFKPVLNLELFDRACVSYSNMALSIVQMHYYNLIKQLKAQIARMPYAYKIHRILFR
jgi:glycosyltransferase involved in cell wall biosynthesis